MPLIQFPAGREGWLLAAVVGLQFLPGGCQPLPPPVPPDGTDVTSDGEMPTLVFELAHTGLSSPVDLQSPDDRTGRLFIVEQAGRIRIGRGGELQGEDDSFLDITDLVESASNEQGLLGLAFHPRFAANGRFYVNYTRRDDGNGETVLAEYIVSADPDVADRNGGRILLQIAQPFENHNGGQLQFGPDGMLYMGTGDGGLACDLSDNAQDPQSLLGKMLRLDVDNPPSYIPADNPFVEDSSTRAEIWARGLRNPWRFSFDPATGSLYIADVGQQAREEVNIIAADPGISPNFGWRSFEGTLSPPLLCGLSEFDVGDAIAPVAEYTHSEGCAITGGYVYRGEAIPTLDGVYFYSDFCSAFIRTLRFENGEVVGASDLTDSISVAGGTIDNPTSFGLDGDGELYLLDRDGDVFRLTASSPTGQTTPDRS